MWQIWWMRRGSACFTLVLGQHSSGEREHLFGEDGAGKETNVLAGILGAFFAGIAKHEDGKRRYAGVQLGDKRRAADAGEAVS